MYRVSDVLHFDIILISIQVSDIQLNNLVAIARRIHLFPFRTQQLSFSAPMVLGGQPPGRVGRCQLFNWPLGQAVKTPPFHGGNRGSIPLGVTIYGSIAQLGEHLPYKQRVTGSSPVTPTKLTFE